MSETGSQDSVSAESADPSTQKPRLTGLPLLFVALGVVLLVQAAFVNSYVGALHYPKPHDVPVGVVGASPLPIAVAKQFSLKLTQYSSESAASAAIDQRKVVGAYVAGPAGAKLIVAPAAGPAVASALGSAFGAAPPPSARSSRSFRSTLSRPATQAGSSRSSWSWPSSSAGTSRRRSRWLTAARRRGTGAWRRWPASR